MLTHTAAHQNTPSSPLLLPALLLQQPMHVHCAPSRCWMLNVYMMVLLLLVCCRFRFIAKPALPVGTWVMQLPWAGEGSSVGGCCMLGDQSMLTLQAGYSPCTEPIPG